MEIIGRLRLTRLRKKRLRDGKGIKEFKVARKACR